MKVLILTLVFSLLVPTVCAVTVTPIKFALENAGGDLSCYQSGSVGTYQGESWTVSQLPLEEEVEWDVWIGWYDVGPAVDDVDLIYCEGEMVSDSSVPWILSTNSAYAIENSAWYPMDVETKLHGFVQFEITSDNPWQLNVEFSGEKYPASGLSMNVSVQDSSWNLLQNVERTFSWDDDWLGPENDTAFFDSGTYYLTLEVETEAKVSVSWPPEEGGEPKKVESFAKGQIKADVTAVPENHPPTVSKPEQFKSNGQTEIPVGGATDESTLVFKAQVNDPDVDNVKLQIELRRLDEYEGKFLNEFTSESGFVASGREATVTVYGLVNGNYHWQARAVDKRGLHSNWVQFGGNDISKSDFLNDPDVYWLGSVIVSELGSIYDKYLGRYVTFTDAERACVGWTVINRRNLKMWGCETIEQVVRFQGQYAYGQVPNSEILELSRDLLYGKIPDPTGGATHFFSPISMPKEGEPRNGYDTSGGLHWVPKPSNITELTYFPGFGAKDIHKHNSACPGYTTACASDTHEWIGPIPDVHNDYVMVYREKISKQTGQLHSPGELRVYDCCGLVTGVVNGTVVSEIPGSEYFNNTIVIHFPSGSYQYEVAGTGEGVYGLSVTSVTRQGDITFVATEIPTCANALHLYVIDWHTLSEGGQGATLQIDGNGDGTFEQTITAGAKLEVPANVDSMVGITVGRADYDRKTQQSGVSATVENKSGTPISSPVWLVIESISGSGVTLARRDGTTTDGKGYIDLSGLLGDGNFSPGEKVTARVNFNNPQNVRFTFKPSVRGMISL